MRAWRGEEGRLLWLEAATRTQVSAANSPAVLQRAMEEEEGMAGCGCEEGGWACCRRPCRG